MLENDLAVVALSRSDWEMVKLALDEVTGLCGPTAAERCRGLIESIRTQTSLTVLAGRRDSGPTPSESGDQQASTMGPRPVTAGGNVIQIPQDVSTNAKHSPNCVRCGAPAHMWSGAWLLGGEGQWIGWCSNPCKNAWLNGDKEDHEEGTA